VSVLAILPLACAVAAVWFWLNRAQPILRRSGNQRAELVGLLVTIEAVLAQSSGSPFRPSARSARPAGGCGLAAAPSGSPSSPWAIRATTGCSA
jgi:hypothetical protein